MKWVIHDFEWAAPFTKAAELPEVLIINFPDEFDDDDVEEHAASRMFEAFGYGPVEDEFSLCEYDEWSGKDAIATGTVATI